MANERNSVTIKDVARACGVSTQTISRVLNDRVDVSKATRERVLAVIDRMSYRPNALARGLRREGRTLGAITCGLGYKGVSITLTGVARACEARGFNLILKELPSFDAADMQPLLRSLMEQQVRGIIYAAPQVGDNWAAMQSLAGPRTPPMVFLKGDPSAAKLSVSIDNYAGAYAVTRHMAEQGYEAPAHISGPSDWWESRERKRGWRRALADAGLPAPDAAVVEGDWSSACGPACLDRLRRQYPEMDAVFAANDQMALGVLSKALRDGEAVPQTLGVAGFDNLPESAYFTPALTTVAQNFHKLGELAVRRLTLPTGPDAETPETAPDAVMLEPALVVRESTLKNA